MAKPDWQHNFYFDKIQRGNPEAFAASVRSGGLLGGPGAAKRRIEDPLTPLLECDAEEFIRWLEEQGL